MNYEALKESLSNAATVKQSSFRILGEIARHVNRRATHNEGRDLVIRALAVIDSFSQNEKEILVSLIRSVGLFPYMTDKLDISDLDDYIAYELHRAETMDDDIVFHSLQAKIFYQLLAGSNVVLSASTSVGKSLVIDALLASGKYHNIVVIVPTIALIDETRRRLLNRLKDRCTIITHPTQRASRDKINIYRLTQERVLHRPNLDNIDLFIVDEFYKVDLTFEKSNDRAVDLNLAFHKLAKTGAQFYLLGPNIQNVKGLEQYEYHFIPSEFSTVAVDVHNLKLPTRGTDRNKELLRLCCTLDGPPIVYCQSPRSASQVAAFLATNADFSESASTASAVSWIADKYHPEWSVCQALRYGIGVHHGGVPRALQQYFIKLFNDRKINFLVCTSTIIEGVNTVAKNVIIYDRRKSKDVLDHFTYKNIEGRAGRMREYFVGRVYVLEEAPNDKTYSVEFPIGIQNDVTPISLLLDLDEEDLTPTSKERLQNIFNNSSLSPRTLRQNRHTSIDTQEGIATVLRRILYQKESLFNWTNVPQGSQLEAICELIFDYLEGSILPDYGIFSARSLAWHINSLRIGKNLSEYVQLCVRQRRDDQTPSDAVESSLRFIRNIVCQRLPRDIMVVNAIQTEFFKNRGMKPGNYALFAEQAENLFMPSVIFALDEYGIPVQTAQKIAQYLLPVDTLDSAIARLISLPLRKIELDNFETEILTDVRRVLTIS